MTPVSRKTETIQKERNVNRGMPQRIHRTFSTIARDSEHWKIEGSSNRPNKYPTDTANRIQKLPSRITNIPSFEGSNDSPTDRGG